ncbi:MAG TPA: peptide deformylase [Acidimicrobiales bacterium]|jgi:peptide deformylase|nr:peptide deformylase [Acidimicrobiales bacterium]
MAVRPVLELPDPILKRRSEPIGRVHAVALELATDLVDTMRATVACVGLAAPQIGIGLRAFVVDVTGHGKARSCHGELVLFDPEVVAASGPVVAREGCLSVPHLTGDVARASSLVVRGLTVEGIDRVVEVDAFEARAVLHEIDHLDGLLFLDRVSSHEAIFRRKVYR